MAKPFEQTGMVRNLSRKLIPLSMGMALLIAVLAPVTNWTLAHRNLQYMVSLYAEDLAYQLQRVALESPLWKYETYKFITIADRFHPDIDVSGYRVLDENGEPISGHDYQKTNWGKPGKNLSFTEEFHCTLGIAPIIFNDRRVGTVEVIADNTPIMLTSAVLFCFWSLIGIALAVLVYRFPVKVVRKMAGEIEELVVILQQSEAKYRSIFENADDIIYLLNVDGTFRSLNPAFEKITGWATEEWIGKSFAAIVHPDDLSYANDLFRKTLAGESSPSFGLRLARKSGEYFDADLCVAPLGSTEVTGVVGIARDVTTRKQTENTLRESELLFRFLNDLAEATRSLANPEQIMSVMSRMLGEHLRASRCAYADVEKDGERFIILHDYTDGCASTVGNYQISLFGPRAVAMLQNGETLILRNVETELLPGEGADMFNAIGIKAIICCPLIKELRLRAMMAVHQTTPRDWKSGEIATVQQVVERCWDTIERRTAEEKVRMLNEELETRVQERTKQLQDAQEELVRKEKLAILGQLSGSVGHELRNPLGVMSNAIYYLKTVLADANGTTKEYLDIIKSEIDTSQRIISDLLDFARIRLPQKKTVTVQELVRESLGTCAIPDNVTISLDLPETLPLVNLDPLQIRQVLANIITNAIQAMPEGGGLRITAQMNEANGHQSSIEISFADSGSGIARKNMKKLFQPLFTTKAKGIGLGLVVSKNLVEANGGRIELESAPGKGTTVMVVLPVDLSRKMPPIVEA